MTSKKAGSKQGSWECTDQPLINKMILDEVKQYRRNLLMIRFNYKKAFDSVPRNWILKGLELAQVPLKITSTIKSLMDTWATKLCLNSIETDIVKCQTGVLEGD